MRRLPLNGAMGVQKVKAAVRQRDGFRCVRCGTTNDEHRERYGRSLEVHRKIPGSVYTVSGCELLCRPCHSPEPRSPRGTVPRIGLSASMVDLLRTYAAEHSDEDERRTITWAAKRLLRIGLASEGKGGDPRKEKA